MAILSVIAFLCFSAHWIRQKNPFNPGVIHGALWLVLSLAYIVFQSKLNELTPKAVLVIALGVISFSIGVGVKYGKHKPALSKCSGVIDVPLLEIIFIISAVGLSAIIYQAIQYTRVWGATYTRPDGSIIIFGVHSWFHMLRFELVSHRQGHLGFGSYILNFCYAGTTYLILYYRNVCQTRWLWPTLVIAIAYAIVSTGRTYILLLCCLVIGAAIPKSLRSNGKILLIAILSAAGGLAFLFFAWAQGRLTIGSTNLIANPMTSMIMSYFLMPMAAFDHLVELDTPATWGVLTFRTPLAVLKLLGSSIAVPDMAQPFVKVPAEINVYTVFSPYYRDFGILGVTLLMFLLGILHGWVFKQMKTGQPIYIVANSILFYALLMQFFQDQYFSLMSQWIQIIFWIYIFDRLKSARSADNLKEW